MARSKYVIDVLAYSDESKKSRVMIWADNKSDVVGIDDDWDTGSILWDITAKQLYILNSRAEWIAQ